MLPVFRLTDARSARVSYVASTTSGETLSMREIPSQRIMRRLMIASLRSESTDRERYTALRRRGLSVPREETTPNSPISQDHSQRMATVRRSTPIGNACRRAGYRSIRRCTCRYGRWLRWLAGSRAMLALSPQRRHWAAMRRHATRDLSTRVRSHTWANYRRHNLTTARSWRSRSKRFAWFALSQSVWIRGYHGWSALLSPEHPRRATGRRRSCRQG